MKHPVVSRDEWLAARTEHLRREKEFSRLRDQLSAERRALPWVRVDETYTFDAPGGRRTLADLFDAFTIAWVRHHDRYATAPATA
jgi:predicted dithiol-disulfide oxidoreductase (DUF899 family)